MRKAPQQIDSQTKMVKFIFDLFSLCVGSIKFTKKESINRFADTKQTLKTASKTFKHFI